VQREVSKPNLRSGMILQHLFFQVRAQCGGVAYLRVISGKRRVRAPRPVDTRQDVAEILLQFRNRMVLHVRLSTNSGDLRPMLIRLRESGKVATRRAVPGYAFRPGGMRHRRRSGSLVQRFLIAVAEISLEWMRAHSDLSVRRNALG